MITAERTLEFPAAEPFRPPRLGPASSDLSPRLREVLDELEAIIVDEGFSHLTVSALASRLRCSRRTLYELAESRDELVLVVVDRRLRRIGRQAQQQLRDAEDPADQLSAFLTVPMQELHQHSVKFSADIVRKPAVGRLIAAHQRYYVAILREILDEGVAAGYLRPFNTAIVAEFVDAGIERMWQPRVQAATGLSFDDVLAELTGIVRAALVIPRTTRARRPAAGETARAAGGTARAVGGTARAAR